MAAVSVSGRLIGGVCLATAAATRFALAYPSWSRPTAAGWDHSSSRTPRMSGAWQEAHWASYRDLPRASTSWDASGRVYCGNPPRRPDQPAPRCGVLRVHRPPRPHELRALLLRAVSAHHPAVPAPAPSHEQPRQAPQPHQYIPLAFESPSSTSQTSLLLWPRNLPLASDNFKHECCSDTLGCSQILSEVYSRPSPQARCANVCQRCARPPYHQRCNR